MANEMLERVTDAIFASQGVQAREEHEKEWARKAARAALAATREPTEAMLQNSGCYKGDAGWRDEAIRFWNAMIDATLAE